MHTIKKNYDGKWLVGYLETYGREQGFNVVLTLASKYDALLACSWLNGGAFPSGITPVWNDET